MSKEEKKAISRTSITVLPKSSTIANTKDLQQIKLAKKKMADLETAIAEIRNELKNINMKEMNQKLEDFSQIIDKKASLLDIKKLNSSIDSTSSRFDDVYKEMDSIKKDLKAQQENEELNNLKLKFNSLESKLGIGLKNIKEIQTKMAEQMTMQIIPHDAINVDDDKKDEKFNQFVDETNEKITKIKDTLNVLQTEFTKLNKEVQEKIEEKATKESVTDLESMKLFISIILAKIFKQLDKVVATLSKRFSDKPEAQKGIKYLAPQVKKLYDLYSSHALPKEGVDEALFVKKPLGGYSCASCEKDVNNLYLLINQQPEYANWNKFPVRDPNERMPKVFLILVF